jgi:hypothetical protein
LGIPQHASVLDENSVSDPACQVVNEEKRLVLMFITVNITTRQGIHLENVWGFCGYNSKMLNCILLKQQDLAIYPGY